MIFALIFCVVFFLSLRQDTHSNLVGQQNTANGLKDSIRAGLGATGLRDGVISGNFAGYFHFLAKNAKIRLF